MSYVTDAEVTTELKGILQQPDGLTGTYWATLITSSNRMAYRTIVRKLVARGYTIAQIDDWDDRTHFQL